MKMFLPFTNTEIFSQNPMGKILRIVYFIFNEGLEVIYEGIINVRNSSNLKAFHGNKGNKPTFIT